jgi:hypothetical protein
MHIMELVPEETERQRWIALEGAYNFRDVGGYSAGGGTYVRHGVAFRSDALHGLSTGDVEILSGLRVGLVIDLRAPDEIASVGRGALSEAPFDYLNAPVLPTTSGEALGAPPGDDVGERYLWYLDVGGPALVAALEALARPTQAATVFHCTAGKDRTGVLTALLLGLLGVDQDDIVADYALTDRALPKILDRLATDPIHAASVARIPAERRTAAPQAMRRFLQLLEDRHGGAHAWASSAGITPTDIADLRTRMLASS